MTGWTPLFQQILASSIWSAADHVRLAWITLLALADRRGVAAVTVSGLARQANITVERAEDALKVLSAPDSDTLTQQFEGRRIERCADGWQLLNWQAYREKAKKQIIREQNAEAQARWRLQNGRCSTKNNGEADEVDRAVKSYHPDARTLLHILNEASGRHYRETDSNLALISMRLNEVDVDLAGMKLMILRQCKRWKGTPQAEYLRPETLFGKSKFDGYYAAKDQPIYDENVKPNPRNLGISITPEEQTGQILAKQKREEERRAEENRERSERMAEQMAQNGPESPVA